MVTYEVTLLYPDRPYDEHQRFLSTVVRNRSSGLASFRRHGSGVALNFSIDSDLGAAIATETAKHLASAFWPSFRPSVTLGAMERPKAS